MKRFTKKIAALSFALVMGAATFGGLAAKSAKSFALASAEDYEKVEVTVDNFRMHYNQWICLYLSDYDGPATIDTPNLANYQSYSYLNGIYVNGDESVSFNNPASPVFGAAIHNDPHEVCLTINPIFNPDYSGVTQVTIKAGSEFPSYQTVKGGAKKVYVVKEDVTFYNFYMPNGTTEFFTREDKVTFVDTEVELYSPNNPNPSWPGFKLSVNDFGDEEHFIAHDNLNYLDNIQIISRGGVRESLRSLGSNGGAYTNYAGANANFLSVNITNTAFTNSYKNTRMVYIPKGTMFPSLQLYNNVSNPDAEKTVYVAKNDTVCWPTDMWGGSFNVLHPTFETNEIETVGGLTAIDPPTNTMQNFVFNVTKLSQARGLGGGGYAASYTLFSVLANLDVYNSQGQLINWRTPTSAVADEGVEIITAAVFADFDNGSSDYLIQLTSAEMSGPSKVVFKKGTIFPSAKFFADGTPLWYRIDEDQVFIEFNTNNLFNKTRCDNFIRDYMHMDDVATTDPGTGKCISEGWYEAAKEAFNARPYMDKVGLINYVEYQPAWIRLANWAIANGEEFKADTNMLDKANVFPALKEAPTSPSLMVIITSIAAVSVIAVLLLLKKKKETK